MFLIRTIIILNCKKMKILHKIKKYSLASHNTMHEYDVWILELYQCVSMW